MRKGICALIVALLITSMAYADEGVSVEPADVVVPAERVEPKLNYDIPSVTPDTQIFKRTPSIDGVIDDGEWDEFYNFTTGSWQATTYADWDSDNIYVAVRSNKPVDFLCVLDCGNDGWFHGEDNFEFRMTRGDGGSLGLNVSRYESRNTKIPVAVPVSAQEVSEVDVKSSRSEDGFTIEIAIPAKLIPGFKPEDGKAIGCQLAANTSGSDDGWVPGSVLGDTKECTLVTRKLASLKPLEIGFDLRDHTIARGDDLVGRFHLTNSGNETIDVTNYVVAGEGKAGNYLSSEKVRMENLSPGQHISRDYRTEILSDMKSGSWAVGAEVRSATGRLGSALVSFTIVEPFELEIRLPDKDVRADVKDVTVGVIIKNNRRGGIRGSAKVTFPVGWELWRNINEKEFKASGKSSTAVSFKAKPPLGAIGEIPVKIEITSEGETKIVEGSFRVVNPQ
jgi:hypothetical protein